MNKLNIPIAYEVKHLLNFLGIETPVFWIVNEDAFRKNNDNTRCYQFLQRKKKNQLIQIETNLAKEKASNEYLISKMLHVLKRRYLEFLRNTCQKLKDFFEQVRNYFGNDYCWNNKESLRFLFHFYLDHKAFINYEIKLENKEFICENERTLYRQSLPVKNNMPAIGGNHCKSETNFLLRNAEDLQKCEPSISLKKEIMKSQMALVF
jgi:hypothetical protein